MNKEKIIKDYMKKLGISREEAEQLYEDDLEDFIGEEGEAMTEKAKAIKIRGDSEEKKKKTTRQPKIDELKVSILEYIADRMQSRHCSVEEDEWDFDEIFIKNPQKEITFMVDNCEYSLTLTKHRPKK